MRSVRPRRHPRLLRGDRQPQRCPLWPEWLPGPARDTATKDLERGSLRVGDPAAAVGPDVAAHGRCRWADGVVAAGAEVGSFLAFLLVDSDQLEEFSDRAFFGFDHEVDK